MLNKFLLDDDGASLIEYALIAALVSVVSITILTTLGTTIQGVFTTIEGALP